MKNKDPKRHSIKEIEYDLILQKRYKNFNLESFNSFSKFITPNIFKRFLQRYELYKMTKKIEGSIFECGVGAGGGYFLWVLLHEIFEPFNHTKKIVGFDTFSGFPNISKLDNPNKLNNSSIKNNGLNYNNYEEISKLVSEANQNSSIPHINKYKIVKGNVAHSIPKYLKDNPHTFISILYLDLDLFQPTLDCLENCYKHMSRGSIICFDEINHEYWPGESLAVKKFFKINNLKFNKFDFDSTSAYVVI